MMVSDDDLYPPLNGSFDRFHIGDTAIKRDEKLHALVSQLVDSIDIEAEAFVVTMRYIDDEVGIADAREKIMPNDRSRYAVSIVVRVDSDFLVIFDCSDDSFSCFLRILEQKWVMGMQIVIRFDE